MELVNHSRHDDEDSNFFIFLSYELQTAIIYTHYGFAHLETMDLRWLLEKYSTIFKPFLCCDLLMLHAC